MKRVALVAMLLVLLGTAVEARPEPTGSALPGLGPYDEMMTAQMNARTELEAATADGDDSSGNGVFYGLGIRIRPVANGASLFHTGSIPGRAPWRFARPTVSPGSSRSTAGRRIAMVSGVTSSGACRPPRAR